MDTDPLPVFLCRKAVSYILFLTISTTYLIPSLSLVSTAEAATTSTSTSVSATNITRQPLAGADTIEARPGDEIEFAAFVNNTGSAAASAVTATSTFSTATGITYQSGVSPFTLFNAANMAGLPLTALDYDPFSGDSAIDLGPISTDIPLAMLTNGRFLLTAGFSKPQLTHTITASTVDAPDSVGLATVYVDVKPHVTNVSFSPSSIANVGGQTTTLTVDVLDYNGAANLHTTTGTVTADLTAINPSLGVVTLPYVSDVDANTARFQLSGITTTAATATYSVFASATDDDGNLSDPTDPRFSTNVDNPNGSLTVETILAPTVGVSPANPDMVTTADSSVTWVSSIFPATGNVFIGGGCGTGTPTGNADGTAVPVLSGTPKTSTIPNALLAEGLNTVYVCVTGAGGTGSATVQVRKDTTPPQVNLLGYGSVNGPTTTVTTEDITTTFSANEDSTYEVWVNGVLAAGGTSLVGNLTSGVSVTATVTNAALALGVNTVQIRATDAAPFSNLGTASFVITKSANIVPPAAVASVTLTDTDATAGLDGRDVTVNWAANADADFARYKVYLLPNGTPLNPLLHVPFTNVASLTNQLVTTVTGDVSLTVDSQLIPLQHNVAYVAYVIVADQTLLDSAPTASTPTLLLSDGIPSAVSAKYRDNNQLEVVFDNTISAATGASFTSAGGNFTINAGLGIGGVLSVSGTSVFLAINHVTPNATDKVSAADLNLAASAVTAQSGVPSLLQAGVNISDGQNPILTITAPAVSANITNPFTLSYTLSEAVSPGTLKLISYWQSNVGDPQAPHEIVLNGVAAGANTASISATTLGLVSDNRYGFALSGTDLATNSTTSTTTNGILYDFNQPSMVVIPAFSSPISSTTPTLSWQLSNGQAITALTALDGQGSGFNAYVLEIAPDTNFLTLIGGSPFNITPQTTTSQVVGPLGDGTYQARIKTVDNVGLTSVSGPTAFSIQTVTPTINNVTIQNASRGNITTVFRNGDNLVLTALVQDASLPSNGQLNVSRITADLTALGLGAAVNPTTYVNATGLATWTLNGVTVGLVADGPKTVTLTATDGVNPQATTPPTNQAVIASLNNAPTLTDPLNLDPTADILYTSAYYGYVFPGNVFQIKWDTAKITGPFLTANPITLELSTDNGTTYAPLAGPLPNNGSYDWNVPLGLHTNQIIVRLTAINLVGLSNQDLSNVNITSDSTPPSVPTLIAPTGPLTLAGGTSTTITYTPTADAQFGLRINPIELDFSVDNGLSWASIIPGGTTNIGSFVWNIPGGIDSNQVLVRARAFDNGGNISAFSQSPTAFTIDSTLPTITGGQTVDSNSDGFIDALRLTFSEALNDGTVNVANFSVSGGVAILPFNPTALGDSANDNVINILFTDGILDTGATPNLGYTSGTLADLAGNLHLTFAPVATTDNAAPVRTAMSMQDTNSNGTMDRVVVTYSEPLQNTINVGPWTLAGSPSGAILSVARVGNAININLDESGAQFNTAVGAATLAYAGGTVLDIPGLGAAAFGATAPIDLARPAFRAQTTSQSPATLALTFSENVNSISDLPGMFTTPGNPAVILTPLTGATASSTLVLTTPFVDTGVTPTITYIPGDIVDGFGNTMLGAPVVATDGIAPSITAIEILDQNQDGSVETARITYSEIMSDASFTASDFSIGGSAASVFATGALANDQFVLLSLATPIAGTLTQDVLYTQPGVGGAADPAGNRAPTLLSGGIVEQDKAAPVIMTAMYTNGGTTPLASDDVLTLTFSEPVSDATANMLLSGSDQDFQVVGGGSIANAQTTTGATANDDVLEIHMALGDVELIPGTTQVGYNLGTPTLIADPFGNVATSPVLRPISGAIIINELNWAGGTLSASDEWVEFRNLSGTARNLAVNPMAFQLDSGALIVLNAGIIPANGFFLLSNFSEINASSVLNTTPDAINAATTLVNTAAQYSLYDGATALTPLMDRADDNVGAPCAGLNGATKASMERNAVPGDGTLCANWHTAVASVGIDAPASATNKGTPGTANLLDVTAPTFQLAAPDTRLPLSSAITPSRRPTISVQYQDEVGGSGIDVAQTKIFVDANQDGINEASVDDLTASAVISLTGVSLVLPADLPVGEMLVRVKIQDNAGNPAQLDWKFYVDNFQVTITAPKVELIGMAGSTQNTLVTQETVITVTSLGAQYNLNALRNTLLTSGASSIPDFAAGTGFGYDVSINGGAFSGTTNAYAAVESLLQAQAAIVPVCTTTCAAGFITNTYRIRYTVAIPANQMAGLYQNQVLYFVRPIY